jgi:hypothetical protein
VTVASASVSVVAIAALLTGQATPILTEVGQKPAGAGWQGAPGSSAFKAYTVLWPDAGTPGGSLGDRLVWPLWEVSSQYAQRDDDETPPVFYATAVYQMRSGPA